MAGAVRSGGFRSAAIKVTVTSKVIIYKKNQLMSVTFKPESFIVEVKTGTSPIESWMETQHQLIDVLEQDEGISKSERIHYLELLRNMMPDEETAKKMMAAVFYCCFF